MDILNQIQTRLHAPKNQRNKFGNYNYRNCEDILEAVKPLLKELNCALIISDEIVNLGSRFYVKATATLRSVPDEVGSSYEIGKATGFAREADSKKGMDDAQVTGATSSYARKYALNGLFAIDDNKDADTAERKKEIEERREKAEKEDLQDKKKSLISVFNEKLKDVDNMDALKALFVDYHNKAKPLGETTVKAIIDGKDKKKAELDALHVQQMDAVNENTEG